MAGEALLEADIPEEWLRQQLTRHHSDEEKQALGAELENLKAMYDNSKNDLFQLHTTSKIFHRLIEELKNKSDNMELIKHIKSNFDEQKKQPNDKSKSIEDFQKETKIRDFIYDDLQTIYSNVMMDYNVNDEIMKSNIAKNIEIVHDERFKRGTEFKKQKVSKIAYVRQFLEVAKEIDPELFNNITDKQIQQAF